MRYRPFGRSGLALSTVGLRLRYDHLHKKPDLLRRLILAGLENGINTYHFDTTDVEFLKIAAETFSVVERRLLFICVNAHDSHQLADAQAYALAPLKERLRGVVKDSGLEWVDLLVFGQPGACMVPEASLAFVKSLQSVRMVRYLCAEAETEDMGWLLANRQFDVIKTRFDIDSSWDKRRQIDNAISLEINMFAERFFPEIYKNAKDHVPSAARRGWFGGKAKDPLAGAGTHAFLHTTPEWTPEQLCLAYALSQTTLSCIFIESDSPEHLESLAEVTERQMPSSVPAQIEMARFNDQIPKDSAKR